MLGAVSGGSGIAIWSSALRARRREVVRSHLRRPVPGLGEFDKQVARSHSCSWWHQRQGETDVDTCLLGATRWQLGEYDLGSGGHPGMLSKP